MRFVPADSLIPGMIMARDVISNNTDAFMLKKGVALNEKAIEYIQTQGYMGVYISDLMSADVEPEEVVDQLTIRRGLEAVAKENIGQIINVSADIVAQITSKKDVSVDLFDLRSYDDYTFHHSVNVGVFAVAVGRRMGLKEEDLNLLSLAGICHDLGKSKIDKAIINKPSKLTDEEFQEIKNHPRFSYEILSNNPEIPSVVKQAALLHHENENGSGYPFGKEDKEIPLFAKIIHAVDVYDALTCKRAYKDPFAPVDALEYMNSGKGILFDAKIVDVMHEVIPAYPPGIDVVLSNDEVALVVSHTQNALRPKVKLASTGEIINLDTNPDYKDVTIVKSGIMPADYVGDIDMLNEDRQAVKEIKTKNETVAIIESSSFILNAISDALEEDYKVLTFKDGRSAVAYFANPTNRADIIIADIEMPEMDGLETIGKLKNRSFFNTPVIFLAPNKNKQTFVKCMELGAIDFVLKPANPAYIKDRVDLACHNIRNKVEEKGSATSTKKRVLVVDDSGMALRNMLELLQDTYDVALANSAARAEASIAEKKPDLILLDNNMPECSGEEFFLKLRGAEATKDVPIMFLTSVSDIATVKKLLDLKPDGYMLKSTQKAELLKMIGDILNKKG